MDDLSRPWPAGLDSPRWMVPVGLGLAAIVGAGFIDHQAVLYAESWPVEIRNVLEQASPYGESDWVLYPSGAALLLTGLLSYILPGKWLRLSLRQFAAIFAFVFVGVGAPTLLVALLKRLIGRARPELFATEGPFGFGAGWSDFLHQSFPSGHAATAVALAVVLGFLSPRWFRPALALAAVIAASRLSLGMHYLSDVLAGALVGFMGAYAVRFAFAQVKLGFSQRRDGSIHQRPLSALRRWQRLRRRNNGPSPR